MGGTAAGAPLALRGLGVERHADHGLGSRPAARPHDPAGGYAERAARGAWRARDRGRARHLRRRGLGRGERDGRAGRARRLDSPRSPRALRRPPRAAWAHSVLGVGVPRGRGPPRGRAPVCPVSWPPPRRGPGAESGGRRLPRRAGAPGGGAGRGPRSRGATGDARGPRPPSRRQPEDRAGGVRPSCSVSRRSPGSSPITRPRARRFSPRARTPTPRCGCGPEWPSARRAATCSSPSRAGRGRRTPPPSGRSLALGYHLTTEKAQGILRSALRTRREAHGARVPAGARPAPRRRDRGHAREGAGHREAGPRGRGGRRARRHGRRRGGDAAGRRPRQPLRQRARGRGAGARPRGHHRRRGCRSRNASHATARRARPRGRRSPRSSHGPVARPPASSRSRSASRASSRSPPARRAA